ncbi:amino acid adenylation domain-containing protein [Kitasatospora sp. NPDC048286]|uniref:amino acid adenylation domain-containing protein n=1 Tax=Kitasatospora sp. NPDC048286 TaxID=3364047 RepID=UPI003719601C
MNVEEYLTELRAMGVTLYEEGGKLRYRAPRGALTAAHLATLREWKNEVLARLRAQEYGPGATVDAAARYEAFPLTDVQSAYLLGRSPAFAYGGVACHGYLEFALPLWDEDRVEEAWNALIARHDMLRAVVSAEGHQRVLAEVPCYRIRRTEADLEGEQRALAAVRGEMSHQVRPTEQWPLFELRTTRTESALVLHLAVDLLICDYSSIRILLAELSGLCTGAGHPDPAEATFRDYVLGARGTREGTRIQRDRDYWWDRIDALPPAPALPLRSDAPYAPATFGRHGLRLSDHQRKALDARAAAAGLTTSGVLLQAFAETVGRWSAQPRFTLSLTVQNRLPLHPDVDRIVGDFSSTTLLAVDLAEGDTFEERTRTVQTRLWEDLDHRLCTGVEVLREVARRRGRAEALMPVTFTSTVGGAGQDEPDSLMPGGELLYGITQTPQVWIDCQVMAEGSELLVHWDVRDGVLPDGVAPAMFAAFEQLVHRLADEDGVWRARDAVELPADQREQLERVNATEAPRALASLHAGVLAQAVRTPERVAVVSSARTLDYAELVGWARAVAAALREAGCVPGERVAVVMDKGWEQLVGVLGVLLARGAYLPVDTTQPPLRRDVVLRDAGVRRVLTQSWLDLGLPEGVDAISVDGLEPVAEAAEDELAAAPDDLAYVIYTSGSTGTPKGVMIAHAAALNTVDDINARFAVGEDDRVLGLAQLGFDLSVYDVFGPLSVGGAVVLPDTARRGDPTHWAALIAEHGITVWNSVPAQLQMLADYLSTTQAADVSGLRLAMLSGDWIPVTLPNAIRGRVPGLSVVSLGGATEASIWSIHHPIGEVDPGLGSIPYGRPLANQTFRVLDARLRDCPVHVTGELYIGGVGLALGYLGDAERTAERFVQHPVSGERLYRTGDLGRRMADGEIEFLGRIDRQVKLNGHRVELAEVESALLTHPALAAAAATVQTGSGAPKLIAFAETARTEPEPAPQDLARLASAAGAAAADGVDGSLVTEMVGLLDESAIIAIAGLLREHGLFAQAGAEHTAEEITDAIGAAPENRYLVRRWLAALVTEGRLALTGDRYREVVAPQDGERERILARIDEVEPLIGWGAELVRYHRASETNLGPLVRNEMDLRTLLFPEGRMETAEAAYRDNLISRYNNAAMVEALRSIAERHTGPGPLRVLEIGAGVGGTSTVLVPALDGLNVRYHFTDLSHFFLDNAATWFADYPWIEYGLFDLNRDYREQGLKPNSFDVILLANVLHNAVDIVEGLARLRELLAPGGWLAAIEATRDSYHVMTSMEFNTGLNGFTDHRAQTGQTFIQREDWLRLLPEAGGEVVVCLPEDGTPLSDIGQHVLLTRFKADRESVAPEELAAHLADRLPPYMLPSELQLVDRMPLTGNGKVDRARLDAWSASAVSARREDEGEAPRGGLEQALARLWTEVLPVDAVGRDVNFFALGGDSLLVSRLVTLMRDRLPEAAGLEWDDLLRLVMNRPTVAETAAYLAARDGDRETSSLVRIGESAPAGTDDPTMVLVHDGTGTLIPYRSVIRELTGKRPLVGLVVDDLSTFLTTDPGSQVAELADRHAKALLAAGHRKVELVGYCMGGLLVPELADRLVRAGAEVAGVRVVSSYRVPYLVEDDLLAEYIFGRLMHVDVHQLGYPGDEEATRELVESVTRQYVDRVPEGTLAADDPDPSLSEAGRAAWQAFRALAAKPQEERLRAIGELMPVEDADLRSLDRLTRQYRTVKHSLATVAAHVPTPYSGPAVFVRQLGEAEVFPGMHRDMTEYWQGVCQGGLRIVDVPGDHFTCMRDPFGRAVAEALLS